MPRSISATQWEAYLDEALPPEEMAAVEEAVRGQPELAHRLAEINSRRDAGIYSLGGIWRQARLTCPTRGQLGSYLLGALSDEFAGYIRFHIETVGCRYCAANLEDLQQARHGTETTAETRRRKFFQSSAGLLKRH